MHEMYEAPSQIGTRHEMAKTSDAHSHALFPLYQPPSTLCGWPFEQCAQSSRSSQSSVSCAVAGSLLNEFIAVDGTVWYGMTGTTEYSVMNFCLSFFEP